ncbi:hypothetical protein AWC38_SpisGene25005 [Stylophora pistillata]|uniref:DUF2059 domain-containing protein n=1 Tax=Stylophora pistillata TaxID=50429 RepID=A0A2B4R4A1_STYPI|nr:hypothetical protein AWC38_SpisGene25005 [Stylophora pistillata]
MKEEREKTSPQKKEAILKYLELTRIEEEWDQTILEGLESMKSLYPGIDQSEDNDDYNEYMETVLSPYIDALKFKLLEEKFIKALDESFTLEELLAFNKFYSSPVGQSFSKHNLDYSKRLTNSVSENMALEQQKVNQRMMEWLQNKTSEGGKE